LVGNHSASADDRRASSNHKQRGHRRDANAAEAAELLCLIPEPFLNADRMPFERVF
jgi:hypothetical protein